MRLACFSPLGLKCTILHYVPTYSKTQKIKNAKIACGENNDFIFYAKNIIHHEFVPKWAGNILIDGLNKYFTLFYGLLLN
jgi:hypothetical protein